MICSFPGKGHRGRNWNKDLGGTVFQAQGRVNIKKNQRHRVRPEPGRESHAGEGREARVSRTFRPWQEV